MKVVAIIFVSMVLGGAWGYITAQAFPFPWGLLVGFAGGIVIGFAVPKVLQ